MNSACLSGFGSATPVWQSVSGTTSWTFDASGIAFQNGVAYTVAVQTTSVQTTRTQHCTGTARTVSSCGIWLVDDVSIGCD